MKKELDVIEAKAFDDLFTELLSDDLVVADASCSGGGGPAFGPYSFWNYDPTAGMPLW